MTVAIFATVISVGFVGCKSQTPAVILVSQQASPKLSAAEVELRAAADQARRGGRVMSRVSSPTNDVDPGLLRAVFAGGFEQYLEQRDAALPDGYYVSLTQSIGIVHPTRPQDSEKVLQAVHVDIRMDIKLLDALIAVSEAVRAEGGQRLVELRVGLERGLLGRDQVRAASQRDKSNIDVLYRAAVDARRIRDPYPRVLAKVSSDPELRIGIDADLKTLDLLIARLEKVRDDYWLDWFALQAP